MTVTAEERGAMSTASINDLPDSAFAYIEPGGTKDADGKTTPRTLRHYPVHDKAHAKNALGRAQAQINGGDADGKRIAQAAMPKIKAAARKFGIDVSGDRSAQRDPGWQQRRQRWAGSLVGQPARRSMKLGRGNIEVRARPDGTGGTKFEFRGYGATFGDSFEMWDKWGDPYEEEVEPGAFTQSLSRKDLDTPFLIGHNDAGLPLARTWETLKMGQDSRGLEALATMNGRRSDVQDLAIAVEDGNIDEMSIGFVTRGQRWTDDYEKRYMTDLDLHRGDVSVVALAANPATKGASMVALPAEVLSRDAAEEREGERQDLAAQAAGEALMMKGTALRLPMIDAALDQAQAIFARQDLSKMDPDMAQAVELVGSAGIHVDHILKHEGLPDPDNGAASNWSAAGPAAEARAIADTNMGNAPDYSPGPKAAPLLTCPQCGARLGVQKNKNAGGGDTLIRIDDAGIPTDEAPSSLMSLALEREALERRSRELQILTLAR